MKGCGLLCANTKAVTAGTVDDKGMYTDTEDVDCAVCKCDMWLCAVVSPSCPEKAVCTEHATQLGCPRKEQILLYRCDPRLVRVQAVVHYDHLTNL